jgi:hypothetical protein
MFFTGDQLSSTQGFLQIVITLLGLLTQLAWMLKGLLREMPENGNRGSVESSPSEAATEDTTGRKKRTLLDLSFLLICAALFSLLLTDSLLISGRSPSPGIDTILYVLCMTTAVTGTLIGAWYVNKGEQVAGFLAITVLIVLVISRGGPFFSRSKGSEEGLSLLAPVIALAILAATSLIYSFGDPFARSLSRNRRLLVSVTLVVVVVIGAAALGKRFIDVVEEDPRTPKVDGAAARELLSTINRTSIESRRKLYRLASEAALAPIYNRHHSKVKADRYLTQEEQLTGGSNGTGSEGTTNGGSSTGGAFGENTSERPRPNPTRSALPGDLEAEERRVLDREAWKRLQSAADRLGDPLAKSALTSLGTKLGEEKSSASEMRSQAGNNRIKFLLGTMEEDQQLSYLKQRLLWVHPVGLPDEPQANVSLPGNTIGDRFVRASYYRISQALNEEEKRRVEMTVEFEYPTAVRGAFRDPSQRSNILDARLFPGSDPYILTSRLRMQVSLPLEVEAYVAYEEYKTQALSLVKKRFQGRVDVTHIVDTFNTFNRLESAAQAAFLLYAVNNKTEPQGVYRMLLDFKSNNINFAPFARSQDSLVVDKLRSMLDGRDLPNEDASLVALARAVRSVPSKSSRDTFIDLLKSEDAATPIKRLFDSGVFELVAQIDSNLGNDGREFLECVADPVWPVVKEMARSDNGRSGDSQDLSQLLDEFRSLASVDQEGLLLSLATSLYQPGGEYALDPIGQLVAQATYVSRFTGLLCAAAICAPLLLICCFVGSSLAKKLVGRDRLAELVLKENSDSPDDGSDLGHPVELLGRDDLLRNLWDLAERGWSTIGVVGRRGIGKSHLLYGLSRSAYGVGSDRPGIRVWVSSPSKFQEEEFVWSMFERLALSTEAAIARDLAVMPISLRRLENRIARVANWSYLGALLALALVTYNLVSRLSRADIVVAWIPVIALVLVSMGLFIHQTLKVQPVDLTRWIQRDRTRNPHTVMLYQDVVDALHGLRDRSSASKGQPFIPRASRVVWTVFLSVAATVAGAVFLLDLRGSSPLVLIEIAVVLLASLSGIRILQNQFDRSGATSSPLGRSLMSLIADYRLFASTVVYRLGQGALSSFPTRRFPVLICIDELDKVVDFDDIRTFVRRIKAIFEVPGLYYYVSLAEDTLRALYLGPAEGKNEIDSSFDHIVRIPPVTCEIGEKIAERYLASHGHPSASNWLARTLSTLSFGVPRDIIRRCDEFIARQDSDSATPPEIVLEVRRTHVALGCELQYLSRNEVTGLVGPPQEAAQYIGGLLNSPIPDSRTARLILSVWLLSLIELATSIEDEPAWVSLSDQLCKTGYGIPVDNLSDLKQEIEALHERVLASMAGNGATRI